MENAEAGNFEANFGTAERARKVRFAEEIARRVAVVAAAEAGEIFSAVRLRVGGDFGRIDGAKGSGGKNGEQH